MFISNFDLEKLKGKMLKGKTNVERILIHEKITDNTQIMCILFNQGYRYPPIADYEKGSITFIVLEGKLKINTYDFSSKKKIDSKVICPKEIYKIPRKVFRETYAISKMDTIFVEIIDGSFSPENRVYME